MKTAHAGNSSSLRWRMLLICLAAVSLHAQPSQRTITHPPGKFVVVNGAKLWCESEGKGEALLLSAGGPGASHSYFHPYFSALADSFRLIYFDAFGRGKSDRAQSPKEYTFDRDVKDIEGLRTVMGLGRIILLGHSYGGMVAQAYALKYPSSIRKLILSNTLYSAEGSLHANAYPCRAI